jgi:hypothetical protein
LIGNDPSKKRSFPADESIRAFKSQVSSSLLGKSILVLSRHSEDVTGLTDDEWLSLRRDLAATKGGRRRDPVNVGCPHRGSVLDPHRRDHGAYSADRDCAQEALERRSAELPSP